MTPETPEKPRIETQPDLAGPEFYEAQPEKRQEPFRPDYEKEKPAQEAAKILRHDFGKKAEPQVDSETQMLHESGLTQAQWDELKKNPIDAINKVLSDRELDAYTQTLLVQELQKVNNETELPQAA